MTQSSRPQADNQNNGYDDAGPYSRNQWAERMRAAHTGDDSTASSRTKIRGVIPTYLNLLVPSEPAAGTVRVGSGAGMSYGSYLFNTANVDFDSDGDAPTANPRIDLVCIVENNTNAVVSDGTAGNGWIFPTDLTDYDGLSSIPAYSARLVIVKGAEAGAPVAPTLDQSSTLYMVEIARYQISVAGVISNFTDNREFADIETIVGVTEANDDAIEDAAILGTQVTNGAADDGLGVAIRCKLENDNGDLENASRWVTRWDDATNGSEDARHELYLSAGNADNLSMVVVAPATASVDGNARGAGAVDLQQVRSAAAEVASGNNSFIAGGSDNTASGNNSHAEGSGTTSSGFASHAEGEGTTASDSNAHAEGYITIASGQESHAEGNNTEASGIGAHTGGIGSKASRLGQFARAGSVFSVRGDGQYEDQPLLNSITHNDASWYNLYVDGTVQLMTLETDQVMTFTCWIAGTTQGCTKSFAFKIEGLIENDGGTTTLLASTTTTIYDTDDVSFDARALADNANDALLIQVQDSDGAGDTVRWSAVVRAAEVTFPA